MKFLLTPLREGRRSSHGSPKQVLKTFLLTPLREGRPYRQTLAAARSTISTHAPAGGATLWPQITRGSCLFLLTPLREGRRQRCKHPAGSRYFYSRPCGRGDPTRFSRPNSSSSISTHAPAGGATALICDGAVRSGKFLLTPLREGRRVAARQGSFLYANFYSRPCGRGDEPVEAQRIASTVFLLTPLREGRQRRSDGGGGVMLFLLTPLREGRLSAFGTSLENTSDFYSRPCGRGDRAASAILSWSSPFLLTPLREGRPRSIGCDAAFAMISTHAPAGGATAIFHKSVMRFCGKLPKDDTVLCLASFGFPRRDPKAVYLA